MSTGKHARLIDREILDLDGGILEGCTRLTRPIDLEGLETAPLSRPRIDSLAPVAGAIPAAATAPTSAGGPGSHLRGFAIVAALAGVVANVALSLAPAAPASAARAPSTPAPVVLVQDPLPAAAPVLRSVPVAAAVAAPTRAPIAPPTLAAARSSAPPPSPVARLTAPVPSPKPAAEVSPTAIDTADLPVIPPLPPPPQVAIDRSAAAIAIAGGGLRAASCREAGAGPLTVPVSVTFEPSGRASGARVTAGELVATTQGSCVAAALRSARVQPFDGDPVVVSTTLHLR